MEILKIFRLEYDNTWNSKVIGIFFSILSAAYIYSLKRSATILMTDIYAIYLFEALRGYMASSIVLVVFVSYIFSKSISRQISSGLIKTWLGFPIKRKHLLISKFVLGYTLLLIGEIMPIIYSGFIYGFHMGILIVLFAIILKLFFYTSYSMFFCLMIRDVLASFAGSLLSLYVVESFPMFLHTLGFEDIANIVDINNIALGLYKVLNAKKWFDTFLETNLWLTMIIYLGVSILLLLSSIQIFRKMDLD